MNRFGWELYIGSEKFVIDTVPFTQEEREEKIKQVNIVIDALLEEKKRHDKQIEEFKASHDEDAYYPHWSPTINSLRSMSVDFDDTPIKEEDIYKVDESKLQRAFVPDNNFEDHEKITELIKLGDIKETIKDGQWNLEYKPEHEELVIRYVNHKQDIWPELHGA
jgi:hypothetical protein